MWSDPTTWNVLVTGGASGLGAAICSDLSRRGAQVVAIDRVLSTAVPTVTADLSDSAAATDATRRAVAELDGVDAVVCCAGTDVPGTLDRVSQEDWERVIAVNLVATAAVIRASLPSLIARRGRIVTVASTLGHRAVSDASAYCASKFGVVGLTRALTAELKGRVGVSLLTPGGMHTSFFDDRDEQYKPPADAQLARPEAVADGVVWLLGRPDGIEARELVIMASGEGSWP